MKKLIAGILVALALTITLLVFLPSSPVLADSGNYTGTTSDVWAQSYHTTYATAWNSTVDMWNSSTVTTLKVGQFIDTATRKCINRDYLYFDTSVIPDLASITSATLYLYLYSDSSTTDFNVTLQSGVPTYPHNPYNKNDYNRLNYGGDGGSQNTSGMSLGWITITLNATGRSWIDKSSYTKLVLRSNKDIAGTAPTGDEVVYLRSSEQTGQAPYLSVTWTASAPPIVTTLPATYITMTSARISGKLDSDGGQACQLAGWYDDGTQHWPCLNYSYWAHSGDTWYCDLTGLTPGTTYSFAQTATNSLGYVEGAILDFTTSTSCGNISDLHADPSACTINLSWTRPGDCADTVIRYSTTMCPTDNTSGTEIYNGSGSFFSHTGLTPGTIYHYIFYGYSGGFWGNISNCLTVSTAAGSCGAHAPLDTDIGTNNWYLMTNASRMNFFFLTPMINGVADSFGMPHNTFWLLLSIFILVLIIFLTYLASHNLILAALVAIVIIAVFGRYQMLPLWADVIFGVAALGLALKGASD